MNTIVDNHLAHKAKVFWGISLAYNRRTEGADVSVSEAILALNDLLDVLGPHRSLVPRILDVQEWIIEGKRNRKVKTS